MDYEALYRLLSRPYYGCKKCEAFADTNPDQFFDNEGRCPDCMNDHESMIEHSMWHRLHLFSDNKYRGRDFYYNKDKTDFILLDSNSIHGVIYS